MQHNLLAARLDMEAIIAAGFALADIAYKFINHLKVPLFFCVKPEYLCNRLLRSVFITYGLVA